MLCDIYKTRKKEGLYLYVAKGRDLNTLPEALRLLFVHGELVMTLLLSAEKKLGNANSQDVMTAIGKQGFYLQMPIFENEAFYGVELENTELENTELEKTELEKTELENDEQSEQRLP